MLNLFEVWSYQTDESYNEPFLNEKKKKNKLYMFYQF